MIGERNERAGIIVIPARFESERLPGKPLVRIAGREMLLRVVEIAQHVAARRVELSGILVATDDRRIIDFCSSHSIPCQLVTEECACGTERVYWALERIAENFTFAINFQGDNPLCPPSVIDALIDTMCLPEPPPVATPYVTLSWRELDHLRRIKEMSPFSGTTVVTSADDVAIWFSKSIIPAIRDEVELRAITGTSPVKKHIGVYAYSRAALAMVPDIKGGSHYMRFEGLEQLMFVESGIPIKMVPVDEGRRWEPMPGVNSMDLVSIAEEIISRQGEFIE